ncbi:UNKNOWN [Stylonychia lemnae]|uniref:Uncharacterized protein n=1 Tax=Stylonychia lemnae TaxID=5949 RepID=A0A078A4M4_STYLE|nr:UNKNOWN [Stylonychia lemnae]|eukprot:CDW75714.1 UNKNOWN [Stylonychia lemnae]
MLQNEYIERAIFRNKDYLNPKVNNQIQIKEEKHTLQEDALDMSSKEEFMKQLNLVDISLSSPTNMLQTIPINIGLNHISDRRSSGDQHPPFRQQNEEMEESDYLMLEKIQGNVTNFLGDLIREQEQFDFRKPHIAQNIALGISEEIKQFSNQLLEMKMNQQRHDLPNGQKAINDMNQFQEIINQKNKRSDAHKDKNDYKEQILNEKLEWVRLTRKIEYLSDIDSLTMNIETILNLPLELKLQDLNGQDCTRDPNNETNIKAKKQNLVSEIEKSDANNLYEGQQINSKDQITHNQVMPVIIPTQSVTGNHTQPSQNTDPSHQSLNFVDPTEVVDINFYRDLAPSHRNLAKPIDDKLPYIIQRMNALSKWEIRDQELLEMLYGTESSSLGESSSSMEDEAKQRQSDIKRRSFRMIDDFLFDKNKMIEAAQNHIEENQDLQSSSVFHISNPTPGFRLSRNFINSPVDDSSKKRRQTDHNEQVKNRKFTNKIEDSSSTERRLSKFFKNRESYGDVQTLIASSQNEENMFNMQPETNSHSIEDIINLNIKADKKSQVSKDMITSKYTTNSKSEDINLLITECETIVQERLKQIEDLLGAVKEINAIILQIEPLEIPETEKKKKKKPLTQSQQQTLKNNKRMKLQIIQKIEKHLEDLISILDQKAQEAQQSISDFTDQSVQILSTQTIIRASQLAEQQDIDEQIKAKFIARLRFPGLSSQQENKKGSLERQLNQNKNSIYGRISPQKTKNTTQNQINQQKLKNLNKSPMDLFEIQEVSINDAHQSKQFAQFENSAGNINLKGSGNYSKQLKNSNKSNKTGRKNQDRSKQGEEDIYPRKAPLKHYVYDYASQKQGMVRAKQINKKNSKISKVQDEQPFDHNWIGQDAQDFYD